MVCDGPDPPENNPHELTPPPRHELVNGTLPEESDVENEHFGYEPLPQGPDGALSDHDSDEDEASEDHIPPTNDIPFLEPMEAALLREVWNTPQPLDSIQMDNERARQVMTAMANFTLPQSSIPEWAQSISEEQWKQTLQDRIDRLRNNR